MTATIQSAATLATPVISSTTLIPGQPWPEQGGVYVGMRIIEGEIHHIIIPGGPEYDIQASHNNAAERIRMKGPINGFSDWRHGDLRDLMLAFVTVPHLFENSGEKSIQITATPYGSRFAWAVDFESGSVYHWARSREFRVRPVRSFIASSIYPLGAEPQAGRPDYSRAEIALLDQQRPLRQVECVLRVIPQLTDDLTLKALAELGMDCLNRCQVIADEGMPDEVLR